jgi:hypothetical protein
VNTMENSLLTQPFLDTYPTVFRLTKKLKQMKGYRWVGQRLQMMEAKLMINGVCDILRTT